MKIIINLIKLKKVIASYIGRAKKKISSEKSDVWEKAIDFTELQEGGVDIDDILSRL